MISIVNGYVCMTSCEAASAKQGKDPNAPPGSPPGTSAKDKTAWHAATILDGALANVNAVTTADNAQQPRLDRIA